MLSVFKCSKFSYPKFSHLFQCHTEFFGNRHSSNIDVWVLNIAAMTILSWNHCTVSNDKSVLITIFRQKRKARNQMVKGPSISNIFCLSINNPTNQFAAKNIHILQTRAILRNKSSQYSNQIMTEINQKDATHKEIYVKTTIIEYCIICLNFILSKYGDQNRFVIWNCAMISAQDCHCSNV